MNIHDNFAIYVIHAIEDFEVKFSQMDWEDNEHLLMTNSKHLIREMQNLLVQASLTRIAYENYRRRTHVQRK